MTKILLLNDTSEECYHFGCTATSGQLIKGFKKRGEVTAISIKEIYKIIGAPITYASFLDASTFLQFTESNSQLIENVKGNDIIIINGEGTIHGLNPAPAGLLYVAYIAKKMYGKKVHIVNHSCYPQHDTSLDKESEEYKVYKLVYDIIDFVAIREPISYAVLKQMGISATQSFDLTPLYIRDEYKRTGERKEKQLVLGGSAYWAQVLNILSEENKGGIDEKKPFLSNFIEYLEKMQKDGYNIKFLYSAVENPSNDDKEFINFLQNSGSFNLEIIKAYSLDEWLNIIESASLLVSGRFHHSIAAISLDTPFVALNSNTPKIDGVLRFNGMGPALQYDDPNLVEALYDASKSALSTLPDDKNRLDIMCEYALKNFEMAYEEKVCGISL